VAAVHQAVKDGKVEDLKGLLDDTELAMAADRTGLPPLQKAVLYQREDVVNFFIKEFNDSITAKDNVSGINVKKMHSIYCFSHLWRRNMAVWSGQ
jgi:hypothetical protein